MRTKLDVDPGYQRIIKSDIIDIRSAKSYSTRDRSHGMDRCKYNVGMYSGHHHT